MPDLSGAIERALLDIKDEWGDDKLHVSDLAVALPITERKCPRALTLRLLGMQKRPPHLGQILMFDHGNRIHDRIVDLLRLGLEGWRVLLVEGVVALPGDVTGRFDTLLRSDEGKEYIVDYKTVRGRAFRFMDGPRDSHVLQVRAYCLGADADGGILLYVDREGQNYVQQYEVFRNDDQVKGAIEVAQCYREWAKEYARGMRFDLPSIMPPKLIINENKGPDSIKLSMPWQCQYCDYLDVSCEGALPPEQRISGIVGHVTDEGFRVKEGCEPVEETVKSLMGVG